jgi:hypothetical protein
MTAPGPIHLLSEFMGVGLSPAIGTLAAAGVRQVPVLVDRLSPPHSEP